MSATRMPIRFIAKAFVFSAALFATITAAGRALARRSGDPAGPAQGPAADDLRGGAGASIPLP
jgi:hypothetical protein